MKYSIAVFSFATMYLKVFMRQNTETKSLSAYYRIVESDRNENDRVCHRTLLNIGFWPEASTGQKEKVILLLNEKYRNELALFKEADQQVLSWVAAFWNSMINKKTIDRTPKENETN